MKKLISVLVALMAIGMVSATVDVEVDCDGPGWFNTDICRDGELEEEFGTVTDYINNNEASWSRDVSGSGISTRGVARLLMGDSDFFDVFDNFFNYLEVIFATNKALEQTNQRMDMFEATMDNPELSGYLLNIQAGIITADRTGEDFTTVEGYLCKPGFEFCFK